MEIGRGIITATAGSAQGNSGGKRSRHRFAGFSYVLLAVALTAAGTGVFWLQRTAASIRTQSTLDEARPADVIIVLGAAAYRGRPSPVLEARLNHALYLYLQKLAPKILTTGGAGGDPNFTEGEVGRSYLSQRGVPAEDILVEPEGESTVHSLAAASAIMDKFGMKSCIVVSDGYHIFRVKRVLESRGYQVYGSPRPDQGKADEARRGWLYYRQAIAYGLWRAGINI